MTRRTTGYAVSALCAAALLSACGSADPPVGDNRASVSPSATSPSSSVTPSASPTTSGSASTSMPPSGRARPTVMSGRVTSIKDGCIVFKNDRDARQWVLVGETKGLAAGTAYVIQGVAMDTMEPNCSDALPFHVNDAEVRMEEDPVPLPTSSKAGQVMTLTGTVSDGVEAGCRVIQSDQGMFVLIGQIPIPDGRVTVTGTTETNQMSTCQQGPLFEVRSVAMAR
ncbi:hypothetical protein V6K52_01580 [Knoellia sp. S7-12]|uniref:hypothetical protein n=1 Tax=Knoellia sp. S7-12 TaxID=3126698 RepID=UPI003369A684